MKNKQKHYAPIPPYLDGKGFQALELLDDIAHGREVGYDPHELKVIVESSMKHLNEIIDVTYRREHQLSHTIIFLINCISDKIDFVKLFELGLQRYNYLYRNKKNYVSLSVYQNLYKIIMERTIPDD